jgi:hypothetical protein
VSEIPDAKGYQEATLTYFFWLPAGKDEFGFTHFADAPLSYTSSYRTNLERTITAQIREQADRLRDNTSKLAGMTITGDLTPREAELGLRKVQYQFEYESNSPALRPLITAGPISGTAIILSNGLYFWAFNVHYRSDTSDETIEGALLEFLKYDFIERHIRRLFNFNWISTADVDRSRSDGSSSQKLKEYDGILTYYQLDLLYNGLFDASAHPHIFVEGKKMSKDRIKAYLEACAIGSLIRSLSLCGFKQSYVPLFDLRKDFSLLGTHDGEAYLNGEVDLVSLESTSSEWEMREHLLSRISFAAMEQFLRVAVSFGLIHYKTGLDHCRAELVSHSLVARQNRSSSELRRPSLSTRPLTLAELEAYYALLSGKVPVLLYLKDLVEELRDISQPLHPLSSTTKGEVEWTYSRSTLEESLTAFTRQIEAIRADLTTIENNLSAARQDLMTAELTESRKLSEIEAETPRDTVVLESGSWDELSLRLGWVALFLGAIEAYSNLGFWLTNELSRQQPTTLQWWAGLLHLPIFIVVLVTAFFFFRRRWTRPQEKKRKDAEKLNTHVFDYSFLRDPLDGEKAEVIISGLCQSMVDIENPNNHIPCATYSTFRETPSSGVERVKYSLQSAPTSKKTFYVLHIEIDSDLSGDYEQLHDIRLVVRMPSSENIPITDNAREVIGRCVRKLILSTKDEEEVRRFFRERFGWQWPRYLK